MGNKEKERILENQNILVRILEKVAFSRKPKIPKLDKQGRCLLRCPNCKKCLKWREDDGIIKEIWLPLAYFHDERVRTRCPKCKKPIDRRGVDPERIMMRKGTMETLRRLRR